MIVACLLFASSAEARWGYTKGEDNPFAGGSQHLAMTMSGFGEIIGFRCTSQDDLSLMYVSIEKPDPEQAAALSQLPAELLVIVDDEPVKKFDASVDVTPAGDRYRVTATDRSLSELASKVASARKRLALAVQLAGQQIYTAAVKVRGSGNAIRKLSKGCQLP